MSTNLKNNLKVSDTILGITFNVDDIEKRDMFVVNKKELKVIEFLNDTTIKFSVTDSDDVLVFDFHEDTINKLYHNNGSFTGLFTNVNEFHKELSRVYKEKINEKLNQLLDTFASRSKEEVKNETKN